MRGIEGKQIAHRQVSDEKSAEAKRDGRLVRYALRHHTAKAPMRSDARERLVFAQPREMERGRDVAFG